MKREQQKLETRRALLLAARALMERQEPVTVAASAREAGVSVATAYRYFSDPETMRLESVVELDLGDSGDFMADLARRCETETSVANRVVAANRLMTEFVRKNEDAYRLFLARGHEQVVAHRGKKVPAPRGGRRIPMIEFALEPWRMALTGQQFQDAVMEISLVCGTESHFVMGDVFSVDTNTADSVAERLIHRVVKSLATEFGVPV